MSPNTPMLILQKNTHKLPDAPGVYFFLGHNKEILYIGKATSLKDRVRSYFRKDLALSRGPLIVQMIEKTASIKFQRTDSVLEALILEANLIRKFQPVYNTKEKDDKSYNYIVITREDFPRVLVARGKDLATEFPVNSRLYFIGPFPYGSTLKEAMKIIRRIFPFRDKCALRAVAKLATPISQPPSNSKLCFNAQIGLCPGVCAGTISKQSYQNQIKNLILFLEGKKKTVIKNLEKEMTHFAAEEKFEEAGKLKKKIFSLNHIQDISLIKAKTDSGGSDTKKSFRIEAYDVAHISGKDMAGVMVVISDGVTDKSQYRKFKIRQFTQANDIGALKEILDRRLAREEWAFPDMIVVDGGVAQKNIAEKAIASLGLEIEIVAVVKDEYHRPREILWQKNSDKSHKKEVLLANAEAHRFAIAYHKFLRAKDFLK